MELEEIRALLNVDPKLITGVLIALGAKELVWEFFKRRWAKEDEKDSDHKKLEELTEKMGEILQKLEKMEAHDREGILNDFVLLESTIAEMQNRAIVKGKVSRTCMPRYLKDYKRYIKLAEDTEDYEVSEEIKLNHQRILAIVNEGKIADSLEEWYK